MNEIILRSYQVIKVNINVIRSLIKFFVINQEFNFGNLIK